MRDADGLALSSRKHAWTIGAPAAPVLYEALWFASGAFHPASPTSNRSGKPRRHRAASGVKLNTSISVDTVRCTVGTRRARVIAVAQIGADAAFDNLSVLPVACRCQQARWGIIVEFSEASQQSAIACRAFHDTANGHRLPRVQVSPRTGIRVPFHPAGGMTGCSVVLATGKAPWAGGARGGAPGTRETTFDR